MCVGRYGQNVTVTQNAIIKFAHQSNSILDEKYVGIKRGSVSLSVFIDL